VLKGAFAAFRTFDRYAAQPMRHLGVRRLAAYCLNPSCRHEGLIDVSKYADDVEVPSFGRKVVCAKYGDVVVTSTCGQLERTIPTAIRLAVSLLHGREHNTRSPLSLILHC